MIKLELTPVEFIAVIGSLIAEKNHIDEFISAVSPDDKTTKRYLHEKEVIINLLERIKN